MKQRLQGIVAGLTIGSILTAGVAFAKSGTETLEVMYDNIKIVVDGSQCDPKDVNGNSVEPFIYNGTTYLPARAVAEALGEKVLWDDKDKVVYISDYTNPYSLISKPYEDCSDFSSLEIKNNDNDNNSSLNFVLKPQNSDDSFWFWEYITYDIEGNNRLTCKLLPPQSDDKSEITYAIQAGGAANKMVTLTNGSEPVDIDIDISGSSTVTIYVDGTSTSDNVVIGSIQNLMVWKD